MKNANITYKGPPIDDSETVEHLSENLRDILEDINGFILYHGALHVRGACNQPEWHSLRKTWTGDLAINAIYASVEADDIPFAQDCIGDQFLIRHSKIFRLVAETGEIEEAALNINEFFRKIEQDPEEYLSFNPKIKLEPGQLLLVYPLLCRKESESDVSLKVCPADEVIRFHADLAGQISNLTNGEKAEFRFKA